MHDVYEGWSSTLNIAKLCKHEAQLGSRPHIPDLPRVNVSKSIMCLYKSDSRAHFLHQREKGQAGGQADHMDVVVSRSERHQIFNSSQSERHTVNTKKRSIIGAIGLNFL